MLNHPVYGERHQTIEGGDPLATSPTCMMLYRSVFPGINNVVRYIRVYAAICWMVDVIKKTAEVTPNPDILEMSKAGLEKIQLLLMWYNLHQNVPGIPGYRRNFSPESGVVHLRYYSTVSDAPTEDSDENYIPASEGAHFLDPGQYRPGLVNGFRFIEELPAVPGTYKLTATGEAMAKAFANAIDGHPRAEWLADLDELYLTEEELEEMADILDVRVPSEFEVEEFTKHYYPADGVGHSPNWRNRHNGLTLALRALAECDSPQSVTSIRHAMARGATNKGARIDLSNLEITHGWWVGLQVRQYQRLGLGVLFRQVESWLHSATVNQRAHSIVECAQGLGILLEKALPFEFMSTVGELTAHFKQLRGASPSMYMASLNEEELRIGKRLKELVEVKDFGRNTEMESEASVLAYKALVFCALEGECLSVNPSFSLNYPGERVSLEKLLTCVKSFENQRPAEFLAHVVQHFVVLLHLRVAHERSLRDGKSRYRLATGDEGLMREYYAAELTSVGELQDLLHHALFLLNQCNLVGWDSADDTFWITDAGEARLAAYIPHSDLEAAAR